MAEVASSMKDVLSENQRDISSLSPIETLVPGAALKEDRCSTSAKEKAKFLEQRSLDYIAGTQSLLTAIILVLACIVAFSSRLFAVIRFESIIHEFDPWYGDSYLGQLL